MCKKIYLTLKHRPQFLGGMDMESGCASQKTKGGYHANQSETMVTVQMGDKDMAQFGETHPTATQLHLGAFSTINHQHLVAQFYHLRGGVMTKGGKRTSTP